MNNFLYRLMSNQEKGLVAGVIQFLLRVLSLVFGLIVSVRNWAFDIGILKSVLFPCPVISVGNLTTGGVGKTPLVEYIALFVKNELKAKPAVLIRGYMQNQKAESDEAQMLREHLPEVPVIVGADRIHGAREFLKHNQADVFILDDGFQHRQIKRQLEIVVIDSTNPFGGGMLLPRGFLREPLTSLKRADVIILSKINLSPDKGEMVVREIRKVVPETLMIKSVHQPVALRNVKTKQLSPLSMASDMRVVSVSSIGDPAAFEQSIKNCGAQLVKSFRYADHYSYTSEDIRELVDYCGRENIANIITTEKDAVKLEEFVSLFAPAINLISVKIQYQFGEQEDVFRGRIRALLG